MLQMQARLLDTDAFRDTVAVLQAGQASLRSLMRARTAARLQNSMQQCVALSRERAARAERVAWLKEDLERSESSLKGADPQRMQSLTGRLGPAQQQSGKHRHWWSSLASDTTAIEAPGAAGESKADGAAAQQGVLLLSSLATLC